MGWVEQRGISNAAKSYSSACCTTAVGIALKGAQEKKLIHSFYFLNELSVPNKHQNHNGFVWLLIIKGA